MERGVKRNRMHLEGGMDGRCHSTTRRIWLLENDYLVARSGTLVKKRTEFLRRIASLGTC